MAILACRGRPDSVNPKSRPAVNSALKAMKAQPIHPKAGPSHAVTDAIFFRLTPTCDLALLADAEENCIVLRTLRLLAKQRNVLPRLQVGTPPPLRYREEEGGSEGRRVGGTEG